MAPSDQTIGGIGSPHHDLPLTEDSARLLAHAVLADPEASGELRALARYVAGIPEGMVVPLDQPITCDVCSRPFRVYRERETLRSLSGEASE